MPRRAVKALEQVLADDAGHEGALRALCGLYEEQGRFAEAASAWARLGKVQGEPPLRILALVVRQFRMLLLLHALQAEGVPGGEIRSALGVAPFLVPKLQGQARRFNTRFLEAAMRRLRDIDTQVKTGKIDAGLALDLFVAGVCGVAARR